MSGGVAPWCGSGPLTWEHLRPRDAADHAPSSCRSSGGCDGGRVTLVPRRHVPIGARSRGCVRSGVDGRRVSSPNGGNGGRSSEAFIPGTGVASGCDGDLWRPERCCAGESCVHRLVATVRRFGIGAGGVGRRLAGRVAGHGAGPRRQGRPAGRSGALGARPPGGAAQRLPALAAGQRAGRPDHQRVRHRAERSRCQAQRHVAGDAPVGADGHARRAAGGVHAGRP